MGRWNNSEHVAREAQKTEDVRRETLKAVIYHTYETIRLEEVPIPTYAEDELLIRVHGCGLCGSDILKITRQAPPPVKLGHELTGTIVARGLQVRGFEVGQRVVVAHHVPCGTCHYCRHGNVSMCATFKASNIEPCGFAEYLRVPATHVRQTTLLLPETLSAAEGSFVEPLACCLRAVRRVSLHAGDSVVVMGLGSIGLLMLQAFRSMAARANKTLDIYGVDLLPERLHQASKLGASAVFQASQDGQELRDALYGRTEGRGVDVAVLTAPGSRPFLAALDCVRAGGMLALFAAHSGAVPVDLETLYQRELTVSSTYSSSPAELPLALDLLTKREVRVDSLISHRLPLERFAEGVTLMSERQALKVYFEISSA